MRTDITPGSRLPDFTLTDQTGKRRSLAALQGQDPLIVVLARGGYCPKDRRQHEGLAALWREMMPGVGYCRMVTISTDNLLATNEFRNAVAAPWPFLSDPARTVQKALDIAEYTDPEHNPMVPHTIVCAPDLVIHSIYNGYWFFGRPTTEELRHDLRAILQAARWDYNLGDPAVRAAWERAESDKFYPYGKSVAEVFADGD
jgi:peroxiredoxin